MCDHCGCGQSDHHHDHGNEGIMVSIKEDVLAHDHAHAVAIKDRLDKKNTKIVNIIGGPGCGKTALLTELIPKFADVRPCVVIEGDLATDNDAERIRTTGAPVHQIHTGTACHLTAHDIEHALEHLPLEEGSLVLVENVGNLVCPSMFDLGESLRIVCLSVAEGTDKPQKYPVSFREAGLVVVTKSDLLPYVEFDSTACLRMIDEIKPGTPCVITSMRDGNSFDDLALHIEKLWDD